MKFLAAAATASLMLIAAPEPAAAQAPPLPTGPYRASCTNIALHALAANRKVYVLMASCPNYQGRTKSTQLTLPCRSEVSVSRDGDLVCGYGPGGRGPGGGDRGGRPNPGPFPPTPPTRLQLYGLKSYGGRSIALTGPTPNLASVGFDEMASALKIDRGGRWEICTEPNYRGRCEIVQGEVPNLINLRINDQVSSARPTGNRPR